MQSKIEIDKIVRSNRKSIALEISNTGELIIRAPHSISFKYIKNLVSQKYDWIIKHKNSAALTRQNNLKKYQFGERFYFLGKEYEIIPSNDNKNIIYFQNGFYINRMCEKSIKDILVQWYKFQADKIIKDRVIGLSDEFDLEFRKITITGANKRWGSCSGRKHLNFSWRLVMAPIEVIDYVVIHELAHLKEMNHSNRFWALVAEMLPDYKKYRQWLKLNHSRFYLN